MIIEQLKALAIAAQGRSGLPGAVCDYPAYRALHITAGNFLGIERLEQNLAHFLEQRESRLDRITTFVRACDLDPAPALAAGHDPLPFLEGLDSWVTEHWSTGRIPKQRLSRQFWAEHCDDGSTPLYGFLSDLGLLMGEILIAQRPECRWSFDVMARNREHSSFVNRLVVAGLAVPADVTLPSYYDPGLSAFFAMRTIRYHPDPGQHDLTWNIRARLSYYPALEVAPSAADPVIERSTHVEPERTLVTEE
ncbi:hypothetical protein [Allohahella marinimesophila]|uniref:Uncharacterized protein n=1 Tax=Allohahella marinimesophila TaxID=1054972 RepID=A0ABP7Q2P0_9GAMM